MYGLLNEQQDDVISKYVSDTKLQQILRDIESQLGEKFTEQNFETEIGLSGQIKPEAGGLLPEARAAFEKMKKESGCNDIFIKETDDKDSTLPVSYRSYDDQKRRFLNEGKSAPTGQKIVTAMKRVSIPGYSQHHTGRAIDYGGNTICLRNNVWPNGDYATVSKWGFSLPYMSGNIRMKEPWHLYYAVTQQNNQTTTQQAQQQTDNIEIQVSTYDELAKEIRTKTNGASIDRNTIELDFIDKSFSVSPGNEKIEKIVLIIGRAEPKQGLTIDDNFKKMYNIVVSNNLNSTVEAFDRPGNCRNCFKINGVDTPVRYQLLIVKPKK